jgi:hypothetical protein
MTSQRHRGILGQALVTACGATLLCRCIPTRRGSQWSGWGEAWRLPMHRLTASLGCLSTALSISSPTSAVTFADGLVHVIAREMLAAGSRRRTTRQPN